MKAMTFVHLNNRWTKGLKPKKGSTKMTQWSSVLINTLSGAKFLCLGLNAYESQIRQHFSRQ